MPDMMNLMRNRHSVRSYIDKPIEGATLARLHEEIDAVNDIAGLNVQLMLDDPKGISGFMAKYENFRGVRNYLAMVGPNTGRLDEQCGYFGEHLVLIAQSLGLDTCWAGLGFNRKKGSFQKRDGERAAIAIAIGYGETHGASGTAKPPEELGNLSADSPEWFRRALQAVSYAPTVLDEQGVRFELLVERSPKGKALVRSTAAEKGHFNYIDYGIARYHFETIAGIDNFSWG